MKPIILVAETGSDITTELASQYQIQIVPMHVTFEDRTVDDGTFPVEEICTYYQNTKKVPKTSGSTPEDFNRILDEIHAKNPEAQILYLAYSTVTTCSYQSCVIASEERDYVTCFDTKHGPFDDVPDRIQTGRPSGCEPGFLTNFFLFIEQSGLRVAFVQATRQSLPEVLIPPSES